MRIHYLQHVPYEGLGAIAGWVETKGHTTTSTRFYRDEQPPRVENFDLLIVMGGPMSVNDESAYKWLAREKALIAETIERGKPILGICLGSQLIADVLGTGGRAGGAGVYKNRYKEIGWFPVELSNYGESLYVPGVFPSASNMVFHWHSETFDLPRGAKLLASSEACVNQAYIYGEKVIGLQFHLEITEQSIKGMIENSYSDIENGLYVQHPDEMVGNSEYIAVANDIMYRLLDTLEECV